MAVAVLLLWEAHCLPLRPCEVFRLTCYRAMGGGSWSGSAHRQLYNKPSYQSMIQLVVQSMIQSMIQLVVQSMIQSLEPSTVPSTARVTWPYSTYSYKAMFVIIQRAIQDILKH